MRAVRHVRMRIFLKANDQRRCFQHLRGQVAMGINLKRDNRIRPKECAGTGHQITLAIIVSFGNHRAVHRQHQDVGLFACDVFQNKVAELFIDPTPDHARRLRPCGKAVYDVPAFRLA